MHTAALTGKQPNFARIRSNSPLSDLYSSANDDQITLDSI